jgi:biopolymer transport protein ExbD
VRVWIDGSDNIEVRGDGSDAAALDALANAARAKVGADPRAICAFDKRLSYGAAIGIIDAFKKAGFLRVALAVQPAKSPSP